LASPPELRGVEGKEEVFSPCRKLADDEGGLSSKGFLERERGQITFDFVFCQGEVLNGGGKGNVAKKKMPIKSVKKKRAKEEEKGGTATYTLLLYFDQRGKAEITTGPRMKE